MGKSLKCLVLSLILLFTTTAVTPAQDSQSLKLLGLKRAQLELEKRRGEYNRAVQLQQSGLISEQDFQNIRTTYLQSQVSYQEALIAFMGSEARVSVESAVKIQDKSGRKLVQVTLRYSSRELQELQRLGIQAGDVFPLDYLKELKDVYVALRADGKIISHPYELRITSLPLESPRTLTFQLLKDVENLEVAVSHSARNETVAVYLQKGVSADVVTVNSAQFSQEADLESTAVYDLSLEKFSGAGDVFRLQVLNLPPQINGEFIDPQTQARLSQIKFTEGVTSMKLTLKLYLPKNTDQQVVMDRALEFYVLVCDEAQARALAGRASRPLTPAEIADVKGGSVKLELIPRGVGRLEVQAVNLYHEIKSGESVRLPVTVKNTGSRILHNIGLTAELPLNWRAVIRPERIASLEPGREATAAVEFIPPADAGVGDFEPRLKSESTTGTRKVEGEDKIVRVHIADRTNVLGIGLLVALLVALLLGIVAFGVRLTRR